MMTEISISENFLKEYLPCATIEILTSVHQGLSQAGGGEEPGYEVGSAPGRIRSYRKTTERHESTN